MRINSALLAIFVIAVFSVITLTRESSSLKQMRKDALLATHFKDTSLSMEATLLPAMKEYEE